MACRKDSKGRVLRKGEHYRKANGRYSYIYTDPLGKQRTIYANSLVELRRKEDELVRDQMPKHISLASYGMQEKRDLHYLLLNGRRTEKR